MQAVPGYKARLGEGAIWNHQTRELFWVDIEAKRLLIYQPSGGTMRTINLSQEIGTVVPTDDGQALIALEDGVYKVNLSDSSLEMKAANPNPAETRFNDGKCDPGGRFWVGTMDRKHRTPLAALYRIDRDYSRHTMVEQVVISNGITWSPDNSLMYYIDTRTQKVAEYAYNNATGAISGPRDAILIPQQLGRPDGCTIDAEGMLWIALWDGAAVTRWNPATGKLLETLAVPALNVTSVAFGDDDLSTLYITTAEMAANHEQAAQYPQAGMLFKTRPGVKGIPLPFFKTGHSLD